MSPAASPEEKERGGTPRRSGTAPVRTATGTCRTCVSCRRKKIKCDGLRPMCSACHLKSSHCDYPHDARKTAVRTRKEDVRTLQRQVETLKRQLEDRPVAFEPPSGHVPSNPAFLSAHLSATPAGLGSSAASMMIPAAVASMPASGNDVGSGFSSDLSASQASSLRTMERSTPGARRPFETEEAEIAPAAGSPVRHPHAMSTPETVVDDQEPDTNHVYGATSLLHDQTSDSPLANSQRTGNGTPGDFPEEVMRDRLISYAAIRRQEEAALHSSPSIIANIDFDHVPSDMAMHLLDLHWNRQHLSYLLTYRPAIMDSLARNGPYVNKLLLNAIYFQSSMYSDRASLRSDPQDQQTVGKVFYDRFKALLPDYIDKPTLPTVVALLTCGACLVPRGQSSGWVFCGMAYSMITDLGFHLDLQPDAQGGSVSRLRAIESEMRRRIYWAAYVGDKFQSLFLGRAPAMPQSAGKVSREYLDSYEELEEWSPYIDPAAEPFDTTVPPYRKRPSYALSTFHSLLKLCDIASRIIETLYSIKSADTAETILLQQRDEIRWELSQWRENMPAWLQFDPTKDATPPPHQITPHTTYWTLIILTEQAFLNRGRFKFTLNEPSQHEANQKCIHAALQIWKLVQAYKEAFTLRRAQYGVSYATYCAVLVMLQQTRQDCDDYMECIRFFWHALLEYQRGCNFGLKRPLRLLRSLMRRLERVTQSININATENTALLDLSAFQSDMNALYQLGDAGLAESGPWDDVLLDSVTAEGLLINDTVFGIADDTSSGLYM
ncbi:hypothetical protein GQ53DRAFT_798336 [Thozetella sp. PMI_491]|nr:hypothetical protein GQ53DRAFT_798336 [Thozetella sp. PMI_491]